MKLVAANDNSINIYESRKYPSHKKKIKKTNLQFIYIHETSTKFAK